jgi:hypothetical protein
MARAATNPVSTSGHALAAMTGGWTACAGVLSRGAHMPGVLSAAALILGALLIMLSWSSWRRQARAAWAFLISISAVLGVITLFATPKMIHLGLPVALVVLVPPLHLTAMTLLAISRDEPDVDR